MNIRTMLAFVYLPLAGILTGCAGTTPSTTQIPVTSGQAIASAEQLEGDWIVSSIGAREVQGQYSPRIAFGKPQRVGGMAGCNRFLGDYELGQGGELVFGEMRLTRRICAEPIMFQEALLLNRLRSVKSGRLTADGELLLYFEADALPIRMHPDNRQAIGDSTQSGPYRG
ncbi:META domain-containing protein [Marinobacterium sp. D7]|uniref:META domain-containing protein n=1 Tax=Marinobacterium ramblicola TaxID=2849041 RepID=UPI001C2CE613|nr:META domain-containing protein [Marinobacterium ramblicola]MBV1787934.1 META domain-containing protein [Marinobacterium ramblicola]